jgi:DNA-binding response OmpR family regulator
MQEDSLHNEETVGSDISNQSIITVGPIRVDRSHLQVRVDGKSRSLTGLEGYILNFLAVHANTICTYGQIGSGIWISIVDGAINLIRITIRHLRHKIEPDPNNPIYILTVPDVGYTLVSHELAETKRKTLTDADI